MSRMKGITAGAILATGLLLRPTSEATLVSDGGQAVANSTHLAQSESRSADGPWLASCRYWESMRGVSGTAAKYKQDTKHISLSIQSKEGDLRWVMQALSGQEATGCTPAEGAKGPTENLTRWGIPSSFSIRTPTPSNLPVDEAATVAPIPAKHLHLSQSKLGKLNPNSPIHAVIAIVSDPVHTHLALDFDREIDGLTQAAGDNEYVPSYFWLPWKAPAGRVLGKDSGDPPEIKDEMSRTREPGLILFKHVPDRNQDSDLHSAVPSTLYLFLVEETPTQGINAAQFHNALRYEADLHSMFRDFVSFSFKDQSVSIIGPNNSGSAESLWRSIVAARDDSASIVHSRNVDIVGSTQTKLAAETLNYHVAATSTSPLQPTITYHSFGDNAEFETNTLLSALTCSGYRLDRVAILSEDSTVFGDQATLTPKEGSPSSPVPPCNLPQTESALKPFRIRFPREISLLRNAQDRSGNSKTEDPAPTPFLHLSLRDPGANDSIPQFSPDHTPPSQEAQLMSIGRLLNRLRTQFIFINATNVLDRIYLAQFLHRAVPEARLVSVSGDLLLDRETESEPYIGTVTLSAYSLLNPTPSKPESDVDRAFTDSSTEAYYNAAGYTLWNSSDATKLTLGNYRSLFLQDSSLHTPLWATAVGTDGYYPLGLLADCASDSEKILPEIKASSNTSKVFHPCRGQSAPPEPREGLCTRLRWLVDFESPHFRSRPYRAPALSWEVLCILLSLLSCLHSWAIYFPNYWSPWTRDLAISQGDKRHRRAMYIFIGTVMLFCMGFVTAYPAISSIRVIHPSWHTLLFTVFTLSTALISVIATIFKIRRHLGVQELPERVRSAAKGFELRRIWLAKNTALLFNILSSIAFLVIPTLWIYACSTENIKEQHNFAGPFFSYRCLYPGSGVSPLVPILLILFGWYIWAVCQCLRLRFSKLNRPLLPGELSGQFSWRLYVSDKQITDCKEPTDSCLQSNITSLLVTYQVLKRIWPDRKWLPFFLLSGAYVGLFLLLVFGIKFSSVDRFLWQTGSLPTPFEFLVCLLAFPLIMIGLSGWLRIIIVWSSLRRGVLELLEQLPLRYAFTRIKGVGWINMLRQGGLVEQWLDMARSTESMRQMIHDIELRNNFQSQPGCTFNDLLETFLNLDEIIRQVQLIYSGQTSAPTVLSASDEGSRLDPDDAQAALYLMHNIEQCYAKACETLLRAVLIPYWETKRIGVVEGNELTELPIRAIAVSQEESGAKHPHTPLQLQTSTVAEEPSYIRVAEEFLAIRYVSFIRAVLVSLRRLLIFVSAVFVLTIIAWNSYPFQPRQWIDEMFTALLFLIGAGFVWVFVQMHRNPILNRITDTNANELGADFYLRIVTFGGVPVLTWLAYQFPEVGGRLFRILEPSLDLFK